MFNVLVIGEDNETAIELRSRLAESGAVCRFADDGEEAVEQLAGQVPDVVLVEVDGRSGVPALSQQIEDWHHPPVMALVRREFLDDVDGHLDGVDDFIVKPYHLPELELRIKRLLHETANTDGSELIRCGSLVIDLARCEVTVAGKQIELTFREYELLRFLASNRGRVYTREALLNKVWGYDYYGGDRTVDVHIRRLRSKIEDSSQTFIETVRNIGYRFKDSI